MTSAPRTSAAAPVMSLEQVAALLHAARTRRPRDYHLWGCVYFLGLRLREALELRLDQVERDAAGVPRVVNVPTIRRGLSARTMERPTQAVRVLSGHTLIAAAFDAEAS